MTLAVSPDPNHPQTPDTHKHINHEPRQLSTLRLSAVGEDMSSSAKAKTTVPCLQEVGSADRQLLPV